MPGYINPQYTTASPGYISFPLCLTWYEEIAIGPYADFAFFTYIALTSLYRQIVTQRGADSRSPQSGPWKDTQIAFQLTHICGEIS